MAARYRPPLMLRMFHFLLRGTLILVMLWFLYPSIMRTVGGLEQSAPEAGTAH